MKYIINAEVDFWVGLIDQKLTRKKLAFRRLSNEVRFMAILDRLHEMRLVEKDVEVREHCAWSLSGCFNDIPCLVAHGEPPKAMDSQQHLGSPLRLQAFDTAIQRLTERSVLSTLRLVILAFGLAHPELVPPENASGGKAGRLLVALMH